MAETLEEKWEAAYIKYLDLHHFKDTPKHQGCMHNLQDQPHPVR
jgi:hypothetical protein